MALSFTVRFDPALLELAQMDPNDPINAVLDAWRANANELLQIEIFNVTKRTLERAFDTGALASSVTGRVGAGKPNLVSVWFNPSPQIAQWGRVYAAYQEGPPIGLSTYTNPPRHMLYDSTEDAEQIITWATDTGQSGANDWAVLFGGR